MSFASGIYSLLAVGSANWTFIFNKNWRRCRMTDASASHTGSSAVRGNRWLRVDNGVRIRIKVK